MFCPKCGTKTLDDATFCQKCGAKLTVSDVEQQAHTAMPVQQTQTPNIPSNMSKGKKLGKLPIIIGAVALVIVLIVIVASSNKGDRQGNVTLATTNSGSTEAASASGENVSEITYYVEQSESYSEGYEPAIILYQDGRFSFLANVGEGVGFYNGTYTVNGDIYAFIVTETEFSGSKTSFEFEFSMRLNGDTLIYESEEMLGLTMKGSVFSLSATPPKSIIDASNYEGTYEGEMPYGYEGEDDSYAPPAPMDSALYGRWRASDGTSISLDEYGGAQTSMDLRPWWALGKSTALSWEASNGQLKLITNYSAEYKYTYYPDTGEIGSRADELKVGSLFLHRVNGNTGDSMIGEWDDNDMGGPYFTFNADGTGAFANDKSTTWVADDENVYINYNLYSTYDYYVSGDMLELFFSNGSKIFTKVGN